MEEQSDIGYSAAYFKKQLLKDLSTSAPHTRSGNDTAVGCRLAEATTCRALAGCEHRPSYCEKMIAETVKRQLGPVLIG